MTIPAHWRTKPLDELVDVIGGLWKGKSAPYIDVNVYSMMHMTKDSEFNYEKEINIIQASQKEYEKRILSKDDLLIEKSGGGPNQPVGRVILFPDLEGQNTFSNFTARLRIKNKDLVNPAFLHKYLKYLYLSGVTESYQKNSTNIRNLQMRDYIKVEIPVPSPEEQKEIVRILDSAFERIDEALTNVRQNIVNADELFQSKLTQIFSNPDPSWQSQTINDVCDVVNGGTPKTSDKSLWDGEFAWITPAEMGKVPTPFVKNTKRTLTQEGLSGSSAKLVAENSVILSSRAPIGHLVINQVPMAFNQGCKGIVPGRQINFKLLYYWSLKNHCSKRLSLVI